MSALPHEAITPSHDGDPACRNCGAPIPQAIPPARYCSQCGQETALHPPTVHEFAHEFVGHYVALEGALWKTLLTLVLHPGRLTREYLAGRRRRYVLPLRLYLTASFLFFVAMKLLPQPQQEVQAPQEPAVAQRGAGGGLRRFDLGTGDTVEVAPAPAAQASAPRAAEVPAIAGSGAYVVHLRECLQPGRQCASWQRALAPVAQRWHEHPREAQEHFKHLLASITPYAVFLMLPVFAAFTMLAYRSRRMLYGEHIVFALHLHSFWFLVLLLMQLLPGWAGGWGVAAIVGYGVLALRSVYGGRWATTLLRAACIGVEYGVALTVGTVVMVLGALLLA